MNNIIDIDLDEPTELLEWASTLDFKDILETFMTFNIPISTGVHSIHINYNYFLNKEDICYFRSPCGYILCKVDKAIFVERLNNLYVTCVKHKINKDKYLSERYLNLSYLKKRDYR